MEKKFLALGLAALCMTLSACGKTSSGSENSQNSEPEYNIVRPTFTPEYNNYEVGQAPTGVNMTYYSDIFSRGFSWITDSDIETTQLYIIEGDGGENTDFTNAELIEGTFERVTFETGGNCKFESNAYPTKRGSTNAKELVVNCHKVHVENLEKGKAYSYKIGSDYGWFYGAFIVEKEDNETITALQLSDAQTKDGSKLNVWRNTFTKAVETAGKGLDTVLYNGDQFDQNLGKVNNVQPIRFNMYSKSLDVIQDYKADITYMTSSGNHEPSSPYSQFLHSDIAYPENGVGDDGAFYSFDYNFAHFVVLNTNDVSTEQINWLKTDLANANEATWKVVLMHIAPYSTGDHSNASENQNIVQKLTPIFSENHVDLVLQAHDHTYNKTLPYRWDSVGYTETWDNDEVVNLNPETEVINDVEYDKNPEGTYYVTTGAAGHRYGASESDGIWAEVVNDGGEWKGLNPSKSFLGNKYKAQLGTIKYSNEYESYQSGSYTSDQIYEAGDLATGNVNAPMFGVLNLTKTTLSYNVYTVNDEEVKLFDSLDVLKA